MKGVVTEVLPNALYRVELESGRVVVAGLSTSLRRTVVRLISGNRVLVRLSKNDPSRGQVTRKV